MKKLNKRIILSFVALILLLIIGVVIEWKMTVNAGVARLAKIRSQLDATEPGWLLDEWNERRNAKLPPDDQNVAVLAKKLADQFSKELNEFSAWEKTLKFNPRLSLKQNQLADPKDLSNIRKQFEPIKPLMTQLQEIRKYLTGGFKIVLSEKNVLSAEFVNKQSICDAANKISWHVFLSTQDNDPKTAIEACRMEIHLRHAIGDEPTLESQLYRLLFISNAINNTERTLDMTEPKEGLAELQADFEKTLLERDFVSAMEGQRANADRMCENLASGTLSITELSGLPTTGSLGEIADEKILSRYLRDNQAQILEQITAYRDASKLKGKERTDALKSIPLSKADNVTSIYIRFIMTNIEQLMGSYIRTEAKLSTVIAAIACERYRQANGKWPEKLSDIPKEILKEIPTDPYVGGPVKYKRNKTGIVVYATGKDEMDNGGVELNEFGEMPNTDIGIQLYDPAHRRLPAKVKPKALDDGPPPLP